MSKDKEKKNKPGAVKRAANFAKAISKHAKDNFKDVSVDDYTKRLEICNGCDFQNKGICNHEDCGCILARKAWWRSENCPIGKWAKQQ
tara:strand:+ start:365 stop:628 length:264 start_codon:yes stop_codon:yes gene_type:complete